MNKKLILFIFVLVCSLGLSRAETKPMLLPYPQSFQSSGGRFLLKDVALNTSVLPQAFPEFFRENGISLAGQKAQRRITITLVDSLPQIPINQPEAYTLSATESEIMIKATTETGVYWALQTLRQLLQADEGGTRFIPTCQITDYPAFRLRGFMHDVGRTYISLPELKKEIALLSRFKINTFHWHLTENQAWRLESKRYPELNQPENMTRMPGKFYTLEEARDLVAFCKAHKMLLIPEIDMPGHSEAFRRTFGTDMQSEKGMAILKEILAEVCETFDVPYIHIGTDEVRFTNPDFVPTMVAFIRSLGKDCISWNPGWHYEPGEIAMTQLWSYRGRAQEGIPAIDCRFHYINHFDTFADLVALYNSRIYDEERGSDDLAGAILAVWNDRFVPDEQSILVENNFYPAMLTLAERSWRGGGSCYFDGKGTLLWDDEPAQLAAFAEFENRLLWHKRNTLRDEPFPYVKQTNVRWRITDAFPNEGDLAKAFPPETLPQESCDGPTYTYNNKRYGSRTITGAGIYLRHVWGDLVPAFFPEPKENSTAYATTYVFSPDDRTAWLRIETQNYSRSESDLPPKPGTWDYKGSRVWLNGEELLPPTWTNTHTERSNELPLGNENAVARPPVQVSLHKGWNKLMLKLPIGAFQTPEVRLVKWMFSAVFVTEDGKEAMPDLIYSPDKMPNYSTYYHQRASLFDELPIDANDIVFAGNSITDGAEWHEIFRNPDVKNRGISGDTTWGLYDRLSSITSGHPQKFFLLIGTNNIPRGESPEEIAFGIRRIVRQVKKDSPTTQIYVQSILPVTPHYGMFTGHTSRWQMIPQINALIEKLAREEGVTYIDLFSRFADRQGQMKREYTNDGLHLLGKGYMLWKEIVESYL